MSRRIARSLPDDSGYIFGYCLVRAGCHCDRPMVAMGATRIYCTECGTTIQFRTVEGDPVGVCGSLEDLVCRMAVAYGARRLLPSGPAETGGPAYGDDRPEAPEGDEAPEEEGQPAEAPEEEGQPSEVPEEEGQPAEAAGEGQHRSLDMEAVGRKFLTLLGERNVAIEEMNALQSTADSLRAEVGRLGDEVGRLRTELYAARSTVSDLESSLAHRTNELRDERRVDTVRIAEAMLEYVSAIDNMLSESDDLGLIRDLARARLEQLSNALRVCGVAMVSHKVGEHIGNGLESVEVVERPTDDPSLDGTVCRVDRIGCGFAAGSRSDIPERLTVYRHRPEQDSSDGACR